MAGGAVWLRLPFAKEPPFVILFRAAAAAALALGLAAPAAAQSAANSAGAGPISPDRLAAHVKELESPAYHGRAPGGPGEQKTIEYLIGQFKALGLKPAGDNGGWTQAVPLVRFEPGQARIALTAGGQARPLTMGQEIVLGSQRPVPHVAVENAPLIFVGYGVAAPERGWDDFKGQDLKGKIAVFLINDPDFEAQAGEPAAGKFGGKAATYYARWTYKFEEAARRGALGAVIVHETAAAAYPWSTVVAGSRESYDVVRADPAKDKLLVQGWISHDLATDLFAKAGLDYEAEKVRARRADFRPVELKGASLSASFDNKIERLTSRNVLAALPGTTRPKESVMYGAHWDAFGEGPPDQTGDRIRHGAADDGVGVAGVLEIARAFAQGPRPKRSVVFGLWTAEERGLLGSEYYAQHPSYPLGLTAADFTMDVLETAGPSRDLVLVGAGQNALEDDLARELKAQGRMLTPDPHPERALFYRADHFSVAKRGVPTLLLMGMAGGPDLVQGGRAAGEQWVSDYTTRCYHQVCDTVTPAWDLRGAAQDVAVIYQAGRALADSDRWPEWRPSSEFKAVRATTADERK
jgi:Zn-dependent M28 family amino/carboxypeptidase